MDARLLGGFVVAIVMLLCGANFRSPNFIVSAPSTEFAESVGSAAEAFRRDLAVEWLGRELPAWNEPCPIRVQVGRNVGAGGVTSFFFENRRPHGWEMAIQGPPDRVLDSVLPHEVTHTIFATHFGMPLPRWADEGACSTVEHSVETDRLERLVLDYLRSDRGIPFNQMFAMTRYPRDILPLYAQGYSVASFLIARHGKRRYVHFLEDGLQGDWKAAVSSHYGFDSLGALQTSWVDWLARGRRDLAEVRPQGAVTATEAMQDVPSAMPTWARFLPVPRRPLQASQTGAGSSPFLAAHDQMNRELETSGGTDHPSTILEWRRKPLNPTQFSR